MSNFEVYISYFEYYDVLKLDKSNEINAEQSLNIKFIVSTLAVLKFLINKDSNDEHFSNIEVIEETFLVSIFDIFKEIKELHP